MPGWIIWVRSTTFKESLRFSGGAVVFEGAFEYACDRQRHSHSHRCGKYSAHHHPEDPLQTDVRTGRIQISGRTTEIRASDKHDGCYSRLIDILSTGSEKINFASSQSAGPKVPRTLFENPYASVGIPRKPVSSSLFSFSS